MRIPQRLLLTLLAVAVLASSLHAAPKPPPPPKPVVLVACAPLYAVQVVVDNGAKVSIAGNYTTLLRAQTAAKAVTLPAGATSVIAVPVPVSLFLTRAECEIVRLLSGGDR